MLLGLIVLLACLVFGVRHGGIGLAVISGIGLDRSGTTRIGKYILNHSFMIPGLIGVFTGCCAGFVMAHIVM